MGDTWSLLLSLVVGSIGLAYSIYGKRQSNLTARYCGLAMMIYPYFITNKITVVIVGLVLMILPKYVDL